MQQVVIAKPYRIRSAASWHVLAVGIAKMCSPGHTRRKWGIEGLEFHGLERLQVSLKAGHGVILAPNHCRPCDAFIVSLLGAELRQPFYVMASAHLFMNSRIQRWLLCRVGAFSGSFREGLDREALKNRVLEILVDARRPLSSDVPEA